MPSPAHRPHARGHDAAAAACGTLLADYSLGMTGKELGELQPARAVIPPGTRVHVGFLDSDDLATRTATPGRFIRALASGYDARIHGAVKLHFNPFGGFMATAVWIRQFRGG